ncbi:MAG: hypothetical protein WEB09_00785 [Nitriliruptor sp.]
MRCLRPIVAVALLTLALTGCRLGVRAEVSVARDGSGSIAMAATLDRALLDELDELDVDPTAELTAAAVSATEWQVARATGEDGSLTITLERDADGPDELTAALRELTDGLAETDPALAIDLDLDVDDAGAAQVEGTVELRTPIGPGVVTDDAAAAELEDLAADTIDAELVITLPGPITTADADTVDGRTAVWQVEPGAPVAVTAGADAPTGLTDQQLAAIAGGVLLVVVAAGLVAVALRRRAGDRPRPRTTTRA